MENIRALIAYLEETKATRDKLTEKMQKHVYHSVTFQDLKTIIDRTEALADEAEVLGVWETDGIWEVQIGYERFVELTAQIESEFYDVDLGQISITKRHRAVVDGIKLVAMSTQFIQIKNASA